MSKSKATISIVLGALAGFAAGILSAPKSGKDTRQDIKEASLKAKDTALTEAEKLKTTISDDAHKAKDVAEQKVQEAKDKAGDVYGQATYKAEELKSRGLQAFEAAKEGFAKDPKSSKKK